MPMQWNDQADARLFANVLKLHVVKLDYPALAKAMGNGVTPKAISHRISKIKEKAQAYHRNNPYAFDPEPTFAPTKGGKRGSKAKAKAKSAALDDEEKNSVVKNEPGVKSEPGFYGYEGIDGMTMDMGDLLGMGQLDSDERPLMELARERAATVAAEQMASPSVMMPADETVPRMSVMTEEPIGLGPEMELA